LCVLLNDCYDNDRDNQDQKNKANWHPKRSRNPPPTPVDNVAKFKNKKHNKQKCPDTDTATSGRRIVKSLLLNFIQINKIKFTFLYK